jgi:hypothetical protein
MKASKTIGRRDGDGSKNRPKLIVVQGEYRLRNQIEELFAPRHVPAVPKKGADILRSHLISSFEIALDHGMHPADALAIVLRWASSEMARLGDRDLE